MGQWLPPEPRTLPPYSGGRTHAREPCSERRLAATAPGSSSTCYHTAEARGPIGGGAQLLLLLLLLLQLVSRPEAGWLGSFWAVRARHAGCAFARAPADRCGR